MESKDHAALARFIISQTESPICLQHKTAFFIGCIEPDFNPFTYMRGSIGHRLMRGHNAESAKSHILKCMDSIQNHELNSKYDFFALGTLIHYIADSFTFPHNEDFSGSMKEHVLYEKQLHPVFMKALYDFRSQTVNGEMNSIFHSFSECHNAYLGEPKSMDKDCRYIISACINTFRHATRQTETPDAQIERMFYENTYYHRLV